MKAQLPTLRSKLKTDPKYFKKVYMHTFDLIKPAGSRILPLDTGACYFTPIRLAIYFITSDTRCQPDHLALDMWSLFIPPALSSSPSALSRLPPGVSASESSTLPPDFTEQHFQMWLDFQKTRGKAVSKDTWSLLVDFIRSIDREFKEYDDAGELDISNWYSATR